ncbi:MAG: hypothetical protein O2954_01515 [bacterium]|nr:hypothetical protein [bacterium]
MNKPRIWIWSVVLILGVGWGPAAGHEGKEHVLDTSKENMKKIAQSLGVKCSHCHIATTPEGKPDFEAPSPLKKTAIQMKMHFVDSLKTADGQAVTCETCHQGAARFIPRDLTNAKPSNLSEHMPRKEIFQHMKQIEADLGVKCDFCHVRSEDGKLTPEKPTKHKLMAKYMMDHFTSKLVTLDGEPVTCFTCHQGKAEFLSRKED